ncbi:cation:proton antiporter regulatory subunit [Spirillospora sp. CA-253888]
MLLDRTVLPKVGVAYAFTTAEGRRIAVVAHRDGRRELVIYHPRDPRRVLYSMVLSGAEPRTVAELLGLPTVIDHLPDLAAAPSRAGGEVPDGSGHGAGTQVVRIPIAADSPWNGRRPDDIGAGLSVVAVLRGDRTLTTSLSGLELRNGDVVVAAGVPEAIARLRELLAHH